MSLTRAVTAHADATTRSYNNNTRDDVVTSMGRASANSTQVQIIIFGIQIGINFMIDSRE